MKRKLRYTEKPCVKHNLSDWILLYEYWHKTSKDPIIAKQKLYYWHCPECKITSKRSIPEWHIEWEYLITAAPLDRLDSLKDKTLDSIETICNKLTRLIER